MTYAVHVTVGQTDKQTDRQRLCSCHLVMSSLDKCLLSLPASVTWISEYVTNKVSLAPNGLNLGFFKISFSTFWLTEPKCTKTDLKKSHICPICDKSELVWRPLTSLLCDNCEIVVCGDMGHVHTNSEVWQTTWWQLNLSPGRVLCQCSGEMTSQ